MAQSSWPAGGSPAPGANPPTFGPLSGNYLNFTVTPDIRILGPSASNWDARGHTDEALEAYREDLMFLAEQMYDDCRIAVQIGKLNEPWWNFLSVEPPDGQSGMVAMAGDCNPPYLFAFLVDEWRKARQRTRP